MAALMRLTGAAIDRDTMLSNSHNFIRPRSDAERTYLESLIRNERGHPGDTFDNMKRRAFFSKEDTGLYRDWLAVAVRRSTSFSSNPCHK